MRKAREVGLNRRTRSAIKIRLDLQQRVLFQPRKRADFSQEPVEVFLLERNPAPTVGAVCGNLAQLIINMTEPAQGTPNTSIPGNAMSTPRPGSARSNAQDGEPSLVVIQLREIMNELRETRKVAEKALEKAQNTACREGSKEGKRKQRHEVLEGDSSSSTHSSIRDKATAGGQDKDLDLQKMAKKGKDTDLHDQIKKIVKGYKPQTPAELALEAAKGICKSPFTEDILKAKKPVKFTQPKFKLFEGTTDPIEHIYHFQQQMVLGGDEEALLCKLFPSCLSRSTLIWFRQLKPRSIGGFTQLCEMFISQYICNQKRRNDVTILFRTKQSVGESLKNYLRCFIEEMSTLEECDSHIASLAFREGGHT
ncbi:unnamed protein product [Prunus brigantina]